MYKTKRIPEVTFFGSENNRPMLYVTSFYVLRQKKYMCVSGFPTLPRFLPDPKHFIVNCEQNVVKFAEKWRKMY